MTPAEQRAVLLRVQSQLANLTTLVDALVADQKPKQERKPSEPKIPAFQYQPSPAVEQYLGKTWTGVDYSKPFQEFKVYWAKESKTQRNWDATLMKNPVFKDRMDRLAAEQNVNRDIRGRARAIFQSVKDSGKELTINDFGDREAVEWCITNGYMKVCVYGDKQYLVVP